MTDLAARLDRAACQALDAEDPLAHVRAEFDINEGVVYLDGNSLGVPPRGVAERMQQVVREEWGRGLIRSWTDARWMDAPRRVGAKVARLLGAGEDEVLVADATSVNLFKLLVSAVRARPGRHTILTEDANFPTDLYIADGVASLLRAEGITVRRVRHDQIEHALDIDVAVLTLTHVHYSTGRIHDMPRLTAAAHHAGALALWDLSHSAGSVPVDLNSCGVDLAVGCGYKHLCGGPGAPSYLFAARRLHDQLQPVLTGWLGHAAPFDFAPDYRPAPGILRHLCSSPPILSLLALEVAVDLWLRIDIEAARRKAQSLTDLFIRLVDERCAGLGLEVASPRDAALRGSQVALRHPEGYPVMRALIDRGVIGDFRAPDVLRFGFAAPYTRHVDAWDAVETLREVLETQAWRRPEYRERLGVT